MTYRLLDLLNFCEKAKIVRNMEDGKQFNSIDALNYYGGDIQVKCVEYNSLKGVIYIDTSR